MQPPRLVARARNIHIYYRHCHHRLIIDRKQRKTPWHNSQLPKMYIPSLKYNLTSLESTFVAAVAFEVWWCGTNTALVRRGGGWYNTSQSVKITLPLDALLHDAENDLSSLEKQLSQHEVSLLLNGIYDSSPCCMRIQSGVGGVEAQDWTAMLYRMYKVITTHTSMAVIVWFQ